MMLNNKMTKIYKPINRFLLLIVFVLCGALYTGCTDLELESRWLSQETGIEETSTEWQDHAVKLEKPAVSIGTLNDKKYLYLYFSTNDTKVQRMIILHGMTVWFDAERNNNKVLGVRFPLGARELGFDMMESDRKEFNKRYRESLNELEILGPQRNSKFRSPAWGNQGIKATLLEKETGLVYELRVPLARDSENFYAIETKPGKSISCGIEIIPRAEGRLGRNMGSVPGNMGNSERGRLPRAGRGNFPNNGGGSEEIEIWTTIKLAAGAKTNKE